MSSSDHSSEDFGALRKLLALKRYEVPPPGYFEGFSERVLARIEAGSVRSRLAWWEQLVEGLTSRPLLAGAYALCVVSLVFLGFRVSESLQPAPIGVVSSDYSAWSPVMAVQLAAQPVAPPAGIPAELASREDHGSSVSPLLHRPSPVFRPVFSTEEVRRVAYPAR